MDGLDLDVACEFQQLAPLRQTVRTWLMDVGADEEAQMSTVLATHEAVANAIGHAQPCKAVKVKGRIEDGAIVVEVTDTGTWKPLPDNDERGLGLALIAGLMSDMEIQAEPSGTTVRMSRLL